MQAPEKRTVGYSTRALSTPFDSPTGDEPISRRTDAEPQRSGLVRIRPRCQMPDCSRSSIGFSIGVDSAKGRRSFSCGGQFIPPESGIWTWNGRFWEAAVVCKCMETFGGPEGIRTLDVFHAI